MRMGIRQAIARPTMLFFCILFINLFSCSQGTPPLANDDLFAKLSLQRTGPFALDVQITCRQGLRALQTKLNIDPAMIRVTEIEAGPEAQKIDRIFYSDLNRVNAQLTLGITDTRQAILPARGSLFRIHFEFLNQEGASKVSLKDPLAALAGGQQVDVYLDNGEVDLP